MPLIGDAAIYVITRARSMCEQWRVGKNYYTDPLFKAIDQALLSYPNPFHISKDYLQKRGEKDVYLYGETPLTTFDQIAKFCCLGPQDHFIDLGCGRGRGLFFLSHFYGCHTHGIEQIGQFVASARQVASQFNLSKTTFSQGDILQADLSKATVIYLYGTCLSDETIAKLNILPGRRLISVSEPHPHFKVEQVHTLDYLWGQTEIYIQNT